MSKICEPSMAIYRLHNLLERFISKELSGFNVSYTQAIILCKLAEMPSQTATQKELKEYLQVTSASMSTIIKRMIKNGLLLQKADTNDNRVNIISLTPMAAALVPSISVCLKEADEKINVGFSRKEEECFCSLLRRMQSNLEGNAESVI